MKAIYRRNELVTIIHWNASDTKAKIATRAGLRWAQKHELEVADAPPAH